MGDARAARRIAAIAIAVACLVPATASAQPTADIAQVDHTSAGNPNPLIVTMALDSRGFPVVASAENITECADVRCSFERARQVPIVDALEAAVALGGSDRPVVYWHDANDQRHLGRLRCTTAQTSCDDAPIDAHSVVDDVHPETLRADAQDRAAMLAGFDNGELRVVRCVTASCAATTDQVVVASRRARLGYALALDAGGFPVVVYADTRSSSDARVDVFVVHCNDVACAGANESTGVVRVPAVTRAANVKAVLDDTGRPVVALRGLDGSWFVRCNDPSCADGNDAPTPISAGEPFFAFDLALDAQGRAVVAGSTDDTPLALLQCSNAPCSRHGDPVVLHRDVELRDSARLLLDGHDEPVIANGGFGNDGAPNPVWIVRCRLAGCTTTPGYRLVAADGGVFAFGGATFHGSTGNIRLAQPIVGAAPTPSGRGYWLVARDGGVFAFGDAHFFGSTGNLRLAQPIVGMAPTASGRGYWLVAADGGVFTFGDARFFGSAVPVRRFAPMIAITAGTSGLWYQLEDAAGHAYRFGSISSLPGATPAVPTAATAAAAWTHYDLLPSGAVIDGNYRLQRGAYGMTGAPAVGIAASPSGAGYLIATADGGVFAFGDARFAGSLGNVRLAQPIVAIAA